MGSETGSERSAGGGGPATKKAAAAMCVGVGSFSDPAQSHGLSHFLEHMLFMGSKAFPDENAYDAFLSAHGGYSNAFTETEYTNYHFSVQPEALRGALERFAGFFVAPLCKAESAGREIEAIQSEFALARQSDGARLIQLRCHTAREGHVYRIFGWGNRKSLQEDPARRGGRVYEELLKHYRKHYSAERMTLAVLGAEPLGTLEQWVTELFSDIEPGAGPSPTFEACGPPYDGGWLYRLPALREMHKLHVTFQMPSLLKEYRKKAEDYVSHLVGHEGPGSLLSALKKKGWASGICAGVGEGGYDKNTNAFLFSVTVSLTEAGLAARGGLGCLDALFGYLGMLRKQGPQKWVWEEMADIAAMNFRYLEEDDPTDYVTELSTNMMVFDPQHVVSGEYVHEEWDPALVSTVLAALTPRNAVFELQSSSFQAEDMDQEEPWFEIPYRAERLDGSILERWEQSEGAVEGLALPPRNLYIPKDFSLRPRGPGGLDGGLPALPPALEDALPAHLRVAPRLVHEDGLLRVWHKLDHHFQTPRANLFFALTCPQIYDTPRNCALCQLLVKLLDDALTETIYLADVAQLHTYCNMEGFRIDMRVDGFSHKLTLLGKHIFSHLVGSALNRDRFAPVRESLLRALRNSLFSPGRHASFNRLLCLRPAASHVDDVLEALEAVSYDDVEQFRHHLIAHVHCEVLAHGNVGEGEAVAFVKEVRALFPRPGLPAEAIPRERVIGLESGVAYLHRAWVKNPVETNSAVENYYQVGVDNVRDRAHLLLVEQILGEPCFDVLRTKEQLGYTVRSGWRLTNGVLGFCVTVVSDKYDPVHVDARIETFLGTVPGLLAAMPAEEFGKHVAATTAARLQQDQNLYEETERVWDTIWTHRLDFNVREAHAGALQGIGKGDVQAWFASFLDPASKSRKKLSVQVFGCNTEPETAPVTVGGTHSRLVEVRDRKALQGAHQLCPLL